jgi:hypothetical protein
MTLPLRIVQANATAAAAPSSAAVSAAAVSAAAVSTTAVATLGGELYAGRMCSGVFLVEEAKGVIGLPDRIGAGGAIVAFKDCSPLKNENIEP